MNALIAQLIVLASSFSTLTVHARSLPQSLTTGCPFAEEAASSIVTINGHDILRQTFTCANSLSTARAIDASKRIPASVFISARSSAECTVPSPSCQCGASSECACVNGGVAPSTSDCTTLINSTSVISEIEGPTFFVLPANLEVITFQTCILAVANLASTVTEFCWDDLSSASDVAAKCFSQGFSSGVCVADDDLYLTSLGRSGST